MPDESIEQTLARLRAEHVRCECDFDGDEGDWADADHCLGCFSEDTTQDSDAQTRPWPCDTARLLEHIEGLQAALDDSVPRDD